VGVGDVVVELPGEGTDTVVVAATASGIARLADYANVENLRLLGALGNADAEGNADGNELTGSLGNNVLRGGDGADALYDQYGNDILTYYGRFASGDVDVLEGGNGNDTLITYGGNDVIDGGAGDDSIVVYGRYSAYGPAQADIITLRFGLGDGQDSFQRNSAPLARYVLQMKPGCGLGDLRLESQGGALVVRLSDGSSLTMWGAIDPVDAARLAPDFGLSLSFADGMSLGVQQVQAMLRTPDRVTASEADDLLIGTAGGDAIAALAGDDMVYAGLGNDVVEGGAGNDALFGGAGADTLTGAPGNDLLAGGPGADVYRFARGFGSDAVDDALIGPQSDGLDDAAIDVVEFDGSVATADVVVYRLVNGSTSTGLVLGVSATAGTVDLRRTYTTGTAGAIEAVRFASGTQWDLNAMKARIAGEFGGDGNDTLNGTAGADTLNGRAGDDVMTGLGGDDSYYVDSAGDQVIELSNAGSDTVISTIDFALPNYVERLQLAGAAALRGTGNALNNVLTGNAGANRLDGGAGSDTMNGAGGDDTYVVDNKGDVVTEQIGEGTDTVEASITTTLPANVENLLLTGAAKISGTGNELNNVLVGNSAVNSLSGGAGDDRLDGGAGADSMTGGPGDDTYVVDSASDKTIELANGGFDTVESAITWTLSVEVERLFLTGSNVVNGTGNSSNNWLIGNDASNTLDGGGGHDVLLGKAGNDTLQDTSGNSAFDAGAGDDTLKGGTGNDLLAGGTGNDALTMGGGADIVCFNLGDGSETVAAPVSGSGASERNDTLSVGRARLGQLNLAREGSDLLLKFASSADSLRLKDWYLSSANQTVTRLQWLVDSSADYAPGTSDALRSSRVLVLDFGPLVSAFDAARLANPSLVNWAPSDAQLTAARLSASDTMALGGVLAYNVAREGALASVGRTLATDQLGAPGFGSAMQSIAATVGQGPGGIMSASPLLVESQAGVVAADAQDAVTSDLSELTGLITLADAASAAIDTNVVAAVVQESERAVAASGSLPVAMPPALPVVDAPTPFDDRFASGPTNGPNLPASPQRPSLSSTATGAPPPLTSKAPDGAATSTLPQQLAPLAAAAPGVEPVATRASDSGGAGQAAEVSLFPMSALMREMLGSVPQEDISSSRRAVHAGNSWARARWEAVDAWSALQQSPSATPQYATGPGAVTADIDARLGTASNTDDLIGSTQTWQVRRMDQAAQFHLARLV